MTGNVVDLPPGFPLRLRTLREKRYLTQTDLAERAGVSPRSIHELESGRRERALAKTIMLLAEALDVAYEDFVNGTADAPGPLDMQEPEPTATSQTAGGRPAPWRRRRYGIAVFVAVAVVVAILVVPKVAGHKVYVDENEGVVEVRDVVSGRLSWRKDLLDKITAWRVSPWDQDVLLVGLEARSVEGGRLLACDLDDGNVLWDIEPDCETMARAFEASDVYGGGFSCSEILDADLDGDGEVELIVHFTHSKWYPSAICVINRDGIVESQYASRGRVYDIHVEDLDDDDCDELVCAATDNTPEYQGASVFVLDDRHRSGAGIDPMTSPGRDIPDSSLVRIVIPAWPRTYMEELQITRLEAADITTYVGGDGVICIQVDIGSGNIGGFVLDLDSELRPLSLAISDVLQAMFKQLELDDIQWSRAWIDGHLRFEEGRLVETPRLPGGLNNP